MKNFIKSKPGFLVMMLLTVMATLLAGCGDGGGSSPPPTYSISGTVSGAAQDNVTITLLSSSGSVTTRTAVNGTYSFSGLANGSYTVTPSKTGFAFTPLNRSVIVSGSNMTGQDFSAVTAAQTYSISGTVSISGGGTLQGVLMTLAGSNSGTTTTAADGSYSFSGLANGSYTVTPSISGYTFSPTSDNVTVSGANMTGRNFTATPIPVPHSISGTITVSGSPLSSVTVALSGAATTTATTDSSGNYNFPGLADGTYTVTPSKTGYTFSPSSLTVNLSGADATSRNFTATAYIYSISGTVSGAVAQGVTITLTGAAGNTTTTDPGGNYTFTGLANGSYTVAPSLAGYTFNPVSRAITLSGANSTGNNFTATANPAPTYTLSGTVTGPYVEGITITLGGAGTGTTTTDASGNYSFANLPAGSYTVTPSLAGYTYTPANPTVVITNANQTQNFTAASAITSYSISGTVSYAGSKTGRIYINVNMSGGGNTSWGTSIAAPGPFTIRGVQNGAYTLSAYMDTIGAGARNASNPAGSSTTVTVASSSVTGVSITLADPAAATPVTPTNLMVFPANGGAVIFWDAPEVNNIETATAYKIYWGTDVNATNGSPIPVGARDDEHYIQSSLTDGTNYYYKISSLVGATESAPSAVVGPITIGATTGLNTVSGTVTFPGSVSAPMYVGVYSETSGIYATRIASPSSPQAYSVAGVPNGNYEVFAIIDMNNNGVIDAGDISNTDGDNPITVSGNTTVNQTLSGAYAGSRATTDHGRSVSSDWYNLDLRANDGTKLPVAVAVVSGLNVAVPTDVGRMWGEFSAWFSLNTTRPTVGDSYKLKVTYSDGTSEYISASVTGVLDSFAQSLTTSGANRNIPTFNWATPLSPPTPYYEYRLRIYPSTGGFTWEYPQDGGMPSTQTSVLYNVDGRANPASLTTGTTYNWQVTVSDASRNSATYQVSYTP